MILFYTLLDIGFKRLFLRLISEIRTRIEKKLDSKLLLFWTLRGTNYPVLRNTLQSFSSCRLSSPQKSLEEPTSLEFEFLNETRSLAWPIEWESRDWSRLWQFNLHYFDWARGWLENALKTSSWPEDAKNLEYLIDHWIKANPPGYGDGWHSYTISLRIRNWIWLFRCCPGLQNTFRVRSLWEQLCWLESHPENYNGGNHWIENLTAVAICSLQFRGKRSYQMYRRAISLLEHELDSQILPDGGHEERSVSYHILLLDRIIELGLVIQDSLNERPEWLIQRIDVMYKWTLKIRLYNANFPIFNDSASDGCPDIDTIISFAHQYLNESSGANNNLRGLMSHSVYKSLPLIEIKDEAFIREPIIDLPETGWTILRTDDDWELVFKCGVSSPKHIAGHAHSDTLSFNLLKQGKPLFIEAGTSLYEKGVIRSYERSAAAHNMLQLGIDKNNFSDKNINWIEPVEVWGSFRAGRKAEPLERMSGYAADGSLWTTGSHNAYRRHGAQHQRSLKLTVKDNNQTYLTLRDEIRCKQTMYWRQLWHLGPNQSDLIFHEIIDQVKKNFPCNYDISLTSFSERFGKRISRKTLNLYGIFTPGKHNIDIKLLLPSLT